MIRILHLRKEYPGATPLQDVNAEIHKGEVISVIGPSGTGKSTLLRCMNRLETPTSGEIWVDGVNIMDPGTDLAEVRKKMGMVFQSYNLFSHKMVIENIMMAPMDLLGLSPKEAYREGLALLELVGLADKALKYPHELSGGQQQRVAIARTLAMRPEIVLFDEPTSALDPAMISEVLGVIRALAAQGMTMMIVTHEMRFARDVSSRVFYMDQGVIYEDGPPEQVIDAPKKELTRNFIYRVRTWNYEVRSKVFDFYEMNGLLEAFCMRQFLSRRQTFMVQLVVEELLMNLLLPACAEGDDPEIRLRLDCAEEGTEIRLSLEYPGLKTDPLQILDWDHMENLSTVLLSKYVADMDLEGEKRRAKFLLRTAQAEKTKGGAQ